MEKEEMKLLSKIDYGLLRIRFNESDAKKCEKALKEILKENKGLHSENELLKFVAENPGI